MTRVLYLIDSLAPGGAERSLVDVAPHLVAGGIDLSVAVLHERPGLRGDLEEHGVSVHLVRGHDRRSWFHGTVWLLRQQRPELLHTTLFESDLVGRAAAARCRVPVVCTLASTPYGPEHLAEATVRRWKLRGAQAADVASARVVKRFHAVSQATADTCATRLHIRRDRIDVIPRGRDRSRLGWSSPARRQEARRGLGLSPETPVLLAVARQEHPKGLDVLLRAVPAVRRAGPDLVVLVAGREGRASDGLRELCDELDLTAEVQFLGARDDVADLLCAADAFVLPSRREGLPGAVLEAMAMGTPVVAADLPPVREAVPDETFALLVPPEDPAALAAALRSALGDRVAAAWRAAAARERFDEHFGIETVSRRMVDFYRRAVTPAGSAAT